MAVLTSQITGLSGRPVTPATVAPGNGGVHHPGRVIPPSRGQAQTKVLWLKN